MPGPLTWEHPNADPIGDLVAFINSWDHRPNQNPVVVVPNRTYLRYGPETLEDAIRFRTGRRVRVVGSTLDAHDTYETEEVADDGG